MADSYDIKSMGQELIRMGEKLIGHAEGNKVKGKPADHVDKDSKKEMLMEEMLPKRKK